MEACIEASHASLWGSFGRWLIGVFHMSSAGKRLQAVPGTGPVDPTGAAGEATPAERPCPPVGTADAGSVAGAAHRSASDVATAIRPRWAFVRRDDVTMAPPRSERSPACIRIDYPFDAAVVIP